MSQRACPAAMEGRVAEWKNGVRVFQSRDIHCAARLCFPQITRLWGSVETEVFETDTAARDMFTSGSRRSGMFSQCQSDALGTKMDVFVMEGSRVDELAKFAVIPAEEIAFSCTLKNCDAFLLRCIKYG